MQPPLARFERFSLILLAALSLCLPARAGKLAPTAAAPIGRVSALSVAPSLILSAARSAAPASLPPAAAPTALPTLAALGEETRPAAPASQASGVLLKAFDGAVANARVSEPVSAPVAPASASARLPSALRPRNYDLHIDADPGSERFSGRVRIAMKVLEPTRTVTLHSAELEISRARINDIEIPLSSLTVNPLAQTITFSLPEVLSAGSETMLELEYSGKVGHQMKGLYQSTAKTGGKEERSLSTHFEPADARMMVPSFDEPAFKATFNVTLSAPEHLTLLSNMPAISRVVKDGRQTVRFAQTPPMSTYLLALVAAPLEAVHDSQDGTEISVWALPEQIGQAGLALAAAKESLRQLNDYFGIPYQLPKMDLAVVPDFSAGAMENWGLITGRDSSLLIDPKLSSTRAERRSVYVVAHEFVHQWFGNLVTMKWWNDLWLNEAFATWLGYKIVDRWRPQWNFWQDFEQNKRSALSMDALANTHPISIAVETVAQIREIFDDLTYQKGGAVLRMLESYLGEAAFRSGLRDYMRRFKFGNAEAADLWTELEQASGQPVARMAKDWLTQPGYPIVSVEKTGSNALRLSQHRFAAAPDETSRWAIPIVIRYRLKGETQTRVHRMILSEREESVTLPGNGSIQWAYANGGETGFYRVNLEGALLESTLRSVDELMPAERSGLLNHLSEMTHRQGAPLDRFLRALEILSKDSSRAVLVEVAGSLASLGEQLAQDPSQRDAYNAWARRLLEPHYRRLGWTPSADEDDDTKLSRQAVLSALNSLSPSREYADQARRLADSYLRDPASVDPMIAGPALSAAAKSNDSALFEAYRQAMAAATTPEQSARFLEALGAFTDPALARRLLEMTLTPEIRAQNAWQPYDGLLAEPATQSEAWGFLRSHWTKLRDRLGDKDAARFIPAAGGLLSAERREEVRAFFTAPDNFVPEAARGLKQTLEGIDVALRFQQQQRPTLTRWLAAQARP